MIHRIFAGTCEMAVGVTKALGVGDSLSSSSGMSDDPIPQITVSRHGSNLERDKATFNEWTNHLMWLRILSYRIVMKDFGGVVLTL